MPSPDAAVERQKAEQRTRMRALRRSLAEYRDAHARRLAALAPTLELAPGTVAAGYAALAEEADPAPLMHALLVRGHPLALPRMIAADAPLAFHRWQPGAALIAGPHGIREPEPEARRVVPDVVLVPLLAFDARGHRLGYGGGYYDRTLAALRAAAPVLAVGIAFAGQQVPALPAGAFDMTLDAVLTEEGLRRINTSPAGDD